MHETSSHVETWLDVEGFEGSYQVSDRGRVRSLGRIVSHSNGRIRHVRDRYLKATCSGDGYPMVGLCRDGRRRCVHVHALVLEAFVGPCPDGMECCHRDGSRTNNCLSNLRWDTNSANHHDMVRHGTHFQSAKTSCKYGHLLQAPNLVENKKPKRGCRSCALARNRVNNAWQRHGERLDFVQTAAAIYAELMKPPPTKE